MKIENECMIIEFKNETEFIVKNKNTNEYCELDVVHRTFWVRDSESNTKVYMEWSQP